MFFQKRTNARNRRHTEESTIRRQVFFGVLVCTIVTVLTTALWYTTRLPSLTISDIQVEGGETISHDEVKEVVEGVLAGTYLKLIPYRFSFFYPKDKLIANVASIPRVQDVVIYRDSKTLRVDFTEYAPFALWCSEYDGTPKCYFLDEKGYAFAPGPALRGGTLVRHIREGDESLEKKQAFETSDFRELHEFLEKLTDELKLRVTDVFYTKDGDIRLSVNGGGRFMIRAGEPYAKIFENLTLILASEAFKHLEPGNFQYIDLRFGNKIFVNEQPEVVATTTDATTTNIIEE
jgi:cell division septal protein FtsQ